MPHFARFKDLADKKSEIFDEDLHALMSEEYTSEAIEHYKLIHLKTMSETGTTPYAVIKIFRKWQRGDGRIFWRRSCGCYI
jgi:2-isopropylmalate synthase